MKELTRLTNMPARAHSEYLGAGLFIRIWVNATLSSYGHDVRVGMMVAGGCRKRTKSTADMDLDIRPQLWVPG